jgi:hypothetical protein
LDRVRDDLARGHTHQATRRLRTYLDADPHNLEIRGVLASIYRQTGNLVEAGRWSYLCVDQPHPEELLAFERANPSPWLRLRLLRFNADPAMLSPVARQRLFNLIDEADRVGPPPIWNGPTPVSLPVRRRGITVPCLFVLLALAAAIGLAAIGIYRAVFWLAHF